MPATSHFASLGNFAMGSEVSSDGICPTEIEYLCWKALVRIVGLPDFGSAGLAISLQEGGMGVIRPSLTMLGVSRAFLSTLLPALRGERHFALIENSPSSTQARV